MAEKPKPQSSSAFPRDRDGVPFEDDFTEEREPSPAEREAHGGGAIPDPDVDTQAADDFMTEREFPPQS